MKLTIEKLNHLISVIRKSHTESLRAAVSGDFKSSAEHSSRVEQAVDLIEAELGLSAKIKRQATRDFTGA